MSRRIPLPSYSRKPGSPVHPFPFQISMRALELLQGATFYPAFVDLAVGLYRDSGPDSIPAMRRAFIANGMSQANWDLNIDCLTKYLQYLPSPVFQAAVVESVSHWDWYVGKLGRFIEFARAHGPRPSMKHSSEKALPIIPLRPFAEQIDVLQEASGSALTFSTSQVEGGYEMVLLRNLGVHSQWEVTAHYLKSTHTSGWDLGDVREIDTGELEHWRSALNDLIINSARCFATMYSQAPDFDPYAGS